jgi:microcystin degradation protein MlrC
MRVLTGSIITETNTFSPIPTGLAAYREGGLFHGHEGRLPATPLTEVLIEWRSLAEADGHEVVESIATQAQPGARTVRAVYEAFREELLADLHSALPVDMVLLSLHGAMAAHGYDDCEGDLIASVRQKVGPDVIIGVELDLHCHLTETMVRNATVIVTYKEYPHIDIIECGRDLYQLCVDAAAGRTRPVMAFTDCRMIGAFGTTSEPMRGFVQRLRDLEGTNGILSVSLGHGFAWADVADVGARSLVVADGDAARADDLARQLAAEFWGMASQLSFPAIPIDEALEQAAAAAGLVVMADPADNAGGGAPSDSTFILQRFLERGIRDAALGVFWDPVAVQLCHEAGLGAALNLRIGGKCGPESGAPVDLAVTIKGLSTVHSQRGLGEPRESFGAAVWVQAAGIDLVLGSLRNQVLAPDAFSGLGIDFAKLKIAVVKSTQHFHAHFAPIASSVLYVDTPGALTRDFAAIKLTKRLVPYWPKVADPFAD